jgi:hypothetical protein
MKAIKIDDAVSFKNSSGRTITGHVTKLEGAWATVWETDGSCYRLPMSAIRHAKVITPTPEAQSAFDSIMDKAKIDQGLDNLTIYESPKSTVPYGF